MMTYGDGVSDVPIDELIAAHRRNGTLATITSVQPQGRFGSLRIADSGLVEEFREKPAGDGYWVNGGYFVLSHKVFDLIDGDETVWERGPLESLAADGQLNAYLHMGFWKPMDTLRDKIELEELWRSPNPPWKIWDD
jgi:glucose-1-phosphate cytidylyltransferase